MSCPISQMRTLRDLWGSLSKLGRKPGLSRECGPPKLCVSHDHTACDPQRNPAEDSREHSRESWQGVEESGGLLLEGEGPVKGAGGSPSPKRGFAKMLFPHLGPRLVSQAS